MSGTRAAQNDTLMDGRGSDGPIPEVHGNAAWRGGVANRRLGVNGDQVATVTTIHGNDLMALPQ